MLVLVLSNFIMNKLTSAKFLTWSFERVFTLLLIGRCCFYCVILLSLLFSSFVPNNVFYRNKITWSVISVGKHNSSSWKECHFIQGVGQKQQIVAILIIFILKNVHRKTNCIYNNISSYSRNYRKYAVTHSEDNANVLNRFIFMVHVCHFRPVYPTLIRITTSLHILWSITSYPSTVYLVLTFN
jgi:hypothetical protein